MNPVRVLLADDHALILAAVRSLMERIEGMQVVAEARDGREAVAQAAAHRPDLAILDVEMPELNGIEAAGKIQEVSPAIRVVSSLRTSTVITYARPCAPARPDTSRSAARRKRSTWRSTPRCAASST